MENSGFAVYDSSNVIIIKSLKKGIVCPSICVKLLRSNIGPSASLQRGTVKDLVTAFTTWLPKDCKNSVILTFHMGKLRPSNLDGVLIPSAIFTNVYEDEI